MSGNVSNHVWVEDSTKPLGGYWTRASGTSGGAALVTLDGWYPGECTAAPTHINDVPTYAGHDTGGAVNPATELATATFDSADNVTAILVNPWSTTTTFFGVYVTINGADAADDAAQLRSTEGGSLLRYFVKAGQPRLLKAPQGTNITRISMTAIESSGTPLNYVDLEPY